MKEITKVAKQLTIEELLAKHNIDPEVFEEWTDSKGTGKILKIFDNPDNLCVLVKFEDDSRYANHNYQFQRFFSLGHLSLCSVDKDFYEKDLLDKENAAAILVSLSVNEKHSK